MSIPTLPLISFVLTIHFVAYVPSLLELSPKINYYDFHGYFVSLFP